MIRSNCTAHIGIVHGKTCQLPRQSYPTPMPQCTKSELPSVLKCPRPHFEYTSGFLFALQANGWVKNLAIYAKATCYPWIIQNQRSVAVCACRRYMNGKAA